MYLDIEMIEGNLFDDLWGLISDQETNQKMLNF